MKILTLLILCIYSIIAFAAKDASDFSRVLMDDLKTDVKKEDTQFKRKGRSPASIETSDTAKMLDQKNNLDKTDKNLNQLGPKKW